MLFVWSAAAQTPRIGDINFYGLRKTTAEKLLHAAKLEAGDPLPGSKSDLEDQVLDVPGVVLSRVEAVCCEGPRAILFIGVEERGAPHFSLRSPPGGDALLPQELVISYHDYLAAVRNAARDGDPAEDLTAGHSWMADPQARAFQQQFIEFAAGHLDLLRKVLRNGAGADQRAVAATVIGYAPKKQDIVNDLQYAVSDFDEAVRANAMRSLAAVAVLAARQPDLGIRISPTWFVEVLNSIVLSDRVESVKALAILTDRPNPPVIDLMRTRALPALVEMARWKTLRYALPPFLLVGRIAGLPEAEILQRWQAGDREPVIEKALATR